MDTHKMEKTARCGLFGVYPHCLQPLASKQSYLFLYSLLALVQSMVYPYLSAVLSTVERQFGIRSDEAAWIYSGNEMSQICFLLLLPFLSKVGNKSTWCSVAMLGAALGCLLCAVPHWARTSDKFHGGGYSGQGGLCGKDTPQNCPSQSIRNWSGILTIFFGIFIVGIGSSSLTSFGLPYIDDNIPKEQSPAFMGIYMATKNIGPALGSALGTICLKFYFILGESGDLEEGDAGWLGAWWLGFPFLSGLILILAPLLAFFPAKLPGDVNTDAGALERQAGETAKTPREYLTDTAQCVKRLAKNKIYIWNTISITLVLFGFIGFITFLPKYIEFHFHQKTSDSASYGSLVSAFASSIGLICSGFVMGRYKFSARTITAYNIVIGGIILASFIGMGFLSCPTITIHGNPSTSTSLNSIHGNPSTSLNSLHGIPSTSLNSSSCSLSCSCNSVFQPVCGVDGTTNYFSACAAGCSSSSNETMAGDSVRIYHNCSCLEIKSQQLGTVPKPTSLPSPFASTLGGVPVKDATDGLCPQDCNMVFFLAMGIFFLVGLISSTGRVGSTIVFLRAVEPRDKSASLIIVISMLSLFALLPSPIIFGALLDQTCLIWGSECGIRTNCLVYDTDKMRRMTFGLLTVSIFLSTLADGGVWYHSKHLKLYGENDKNLELRVVKDKMDTIKQ